MGENKLTFETIEIVPGTCLLSECLLYYSYTKYITYVKSIIQYCFNSFFVEINENIFSQFFFCLMMLQIWDTYDCICLHKIMNSYYT